MKKVVKDLFIRLLILGIVFISSVVLGTVIWKYDNDVEAFSIAVTSGTVIVIMFGAMVKNIAAYKNTKLFFGTSHDTAKIGLAAYVMSRLAWASMLADMIMLSFASGREAEDIEIGLVGIFVLMGLLSLIFGTGFFVRRSKEINIDINGMSVRQFTARYGDGMGRYSSVNADPFFGTDERSLRFSELFTGGRDIFSIYSSTPPLVAVIEKGYACRMPDLKAADLEQLYAQSLDMFVMPLNQLLGRLGYGAVIDPGQWHGAVKGFATTQLANRLRDGVNADYFLAHCAERLLEPQGLAIVEMICGQGGRYFGVTELQSLVYLQQLCI